MYSVKLKLYNYNPTRALAIADATMFARTLTVNIKKKITLKQLTYNFNKQTYNND
jgi:hypothetical protein